MPQLPRVRRHGLHPTKQARGHDRRRTEELRSWLFLTAVMVPVLAVLVVSGYGFVVWMLQSFF